MGCNDDEVTVVFVSDKRMRELSRQYRDIDSTTDVLSFAMQEAEPVRGENLPLGDVVISTETAARQALEIGHSLEDEITRLLIHGILHLLGYDHQNSAETKTMRAEEKRLLKAVSTNE